MIAAPDDGQPDSTPMPHQGSRRPLVIVLIGMAMIGALALVMLAGVLWLLIQRENAASTSSAILNQPAPEFRVRTLDGESVRLSDLKGQPVWLSFWAVWCGPCREEMPAVAEVGREAEANGVRLLALNTGEPEETVRSFLRRNSYPGLPVVLDENGSTGSAYQVYNLPTHVFIDADGVVRDVKLGTMDADEMRDAIEELR